jgi:oligosaccharide repeat unit polymerase
MLIATTTSPSVRFTTAADQRTEGGLVTLWLVCLAFLLGVVTMTTRQVWLLPYFAAFAYAAFLVACFRTIGVWRDGFNPLCALLVICAVRHFVPALLLFNEVGPPEEVTRFFTAMHLSDDDLRWGYALALFGVVAAMLGWFLVQGVGPKHVPAQLQFALGPGVRPAALVGMIIGFAALLTFLLRNASLDVIQSGAFRETTVQQGTGKYFFLAYFLIAGAVLLTCCRLPKTTAWAALLPVGAAALFYWVLGGRGRAVTPLAAGLLLLWYLRRQRRGWPAIKVNFSYLVLVPLMVAAVMGISYLGALYRGDVGTRGFAEGLTLEGLWQYSQSSVYTDLGQLHALAGANAIGPAVLGGQTFFGALSWPLNRIIFIPGRSAGIYIVETLVGFTGEDDRWAVNASLVGDAYLNFGLWGVAAVMLLYGAVVKFLYVRFRHGQIHAAVYAIVFVSSVQMLWVSFEVWPQVLTLLLFTRALIFAGDTVLKIPRRRS